MRSTALYTRLVIFIVFVQHVQSIAQVNKDSVWISTSDGCRVHNPHPVRNETITWSGECMNGFADGSGTLTWYKSGKLNQEFTGQMKRGIPNGRGVYRFEDGSSAEGTYINGDLRGNATVIERDREGHVLDVYVGPLEDQVPHGLGTKVYVSETGDTTMVYSGEFVKGDIEGVGMMKQFHGATVVTARGPYKLGFPSGEFKVTETYNDVVIRRYNGGFSSQGRTGYGESHDGPIRYQGQWAEGKPHGLGKLFLDTALMYDGEWKSGKYDGIGKRLLMDRSYYTGEFKDNQRHGFGKQIWPDGLEYVGEFKRDLYSGNGYFLRDKKIVKCGSWENGKFLFADDFRNTHDFLMTKHKKKLERLGIVN